MFMYPQPFLPPPPPMHTHTHCDAQSIFYKTIKGPKVYTEAFYRLEDSKSR